MRQSLLLRRLSPILLASSLVLFTHSLRAQTSPPVEGIQSRTFDLHRQFAAVPTPTGHLGPVSGILPDAPRSQTELRVEFFRIRDRHILININTQAAVGSAWRQWRTPGYSNVHSSAIQPADPLHHYGHYIPWAGSIIPRVSRQAEAHPHVRDALKLFTPKF